MDQDDLRKLFDLKTLLDLAYFHHSGGKTSHFKSAEGSIELQFGNLAYRAAHPTSPPMAPEIESVVIRSSVFTANRVAYFDSLDEAIDIVQRWYQKALQDQSS